MAYTYDDFLKAADTAGLTEQISPYDMETAKTNPEFGLSMLGLMREYNNAGTEEQRMLATTAANQLRQSYGGYTLCENGLYQPVQSSAAKGSGYSRETAYQKALSEVTDVKPFAYDPESDPVYDSAAKAAAREGERATRDTMAQAAALTGGRPSSYAVSAAQQAGNYYNSQLTDMIPTLEQNAYQKYLNDFDRKLSALGALESDRANEIARAQEAEQMELQRQENAYYNALEMFQALGYATPQIAAVLGIPEGTRYDGGASAGREMPGSMLALLQDTYKDGYIRDSAKWDELVADYGEDALTAAGFAYYDTNAYAEQLKALYPEGGVTQEEYNALLSAYGNDKAVLDAAGIFVAGGTGNDLTADALQELRTAYPTGAVRSKIMWDQYALKYGVDALINAGFWLELSYGKQTGESAARPNVNNRFQVRS